MAPLKTVFHHHAEQMVELAGVEQREHIAFEDGGGVANRRAEEARILRKREVYNVNWDCNDLNICRNND